MEDEYWSVFTCSVWLYFWDITLSGLEKSLGSGFGSGKLSVHILKGEYGGVSSTVATLSTKIEMLVLGLISISVNKWADVPAEVKEYIMNRVLDHFDLDYTRQEDVRMMHAYFKKFPSKEAALLKPHPDTTEEQRKKLCDLFASKTFMKNQESGNINPAKLYKKNYTNKDGIWTSEGAREIYLIYFNVSTKYCHLFKNGWMPSSASVI
ncbi:hypothetical protein CJ030_MR8G008946 [Morella rubra]|uniref:Uncharacterized protein n=1 Tax=Morella rubra TaxID=262757 RepID=A0A6A1URL0_9ROSI|nr:hypothetical protein CJ030_MR8G008946 [Morella rubra]